MKQPDSTADPLSPGLLWAKKLVAYGASLVVIGNVLALTTSSITFTPNTTTTPQNAFVLSASLIGLGTIMTILGLAGVRRHRM